MTEPRSLGSFQNQKRSLTGLWEKIAGFAFGVIFISTLLVVSLSNSTLSSQQYEIIKTVLALAAAGVGGILPGFICIESTISKLIVRAGGAFALFVIVFFFSPNMAKSEQKIQGNTVSDITIGSEAQVLIGDYLIINDLKTIHLAFQQYQQQHEGEAVSKLYKRLDVTERALHSFFSILEKDKVPLEKLPASLAELALEHKKALARLGSLQVDDQSLKAKIKHARTNVSNGEYESAHELYLLISQIEDDAAQSATNLVEEALKAAREHKRQSAMMLAEAGEMSFIMRRFLRAAKEFEAATETLPNGHIGLRGNYLFRWAGALSEHGRGKGDNKHLDEAIRIYQLALEERTRERVPLDWATTQNNLGTALQALGERESGTKTLEKAIRVYQLALEERTRERVPLDWATTQNNLGTALQSLGERESGTKTLKKAARAYELALEEWPRKYVPLDWAMVQNNLGNVLTRLGERGTGSKTLLKAIVAYKLALEERTRERVPLDWATTQNNLGAALQALSVRESVAETLKKAVKAYKLALEERTRERVPLDWATTQNNLGTALQALGERESGTRTLENAIKAYRLALEEKTRARVPLDWAMAQNNLGNALYKLGERGTGTETLLRSINAYQLALEEWTQERIPLKWAITQNNLGLALLTMGERTKEITSLLKSRQHIDNARQIYIEVARQSQYRDYFNKRLTQIDTLIKQFANSEGHALTL